MHHRPRRWLISGSVALAPVEPLLPYLELPVRAKSGSIVLAIKSSAEAGLGIG